MQDPTTLQSEQQMALLQLQTLGDAQSPEAFPKALRLCEALMVECNRLHGHVADILDDKRASGRSNDDLLPMLDLNLVVAEYRRASIELMLQMEYLEDELEDAHRALALAHQIIGDASAAMKVAKFDDHNDACRFSLGLSRSCDAFSMVPNPMGDEIEDDAMSDYLLGLMNEFDQEQEELVPPISDDEEVLEPFEAPGNAH